ncbi:hypothetical protein [Gordonia sp. NPDC003422]
MSAPDPTKTRRRLTRRVYALAAKVHHRRLNEAQLAYLDAVLDHYHESIKEMTTDD